MPGDTVKTAFQVLLEALGLSVPFLYAAGVYTLFHWLDKKASVPANNAVLEWLRPSAPANRALADALLEIFDRIYLYPLLRWRAFARSAVISIFVAAIVLYELAPSMLMPRSYATRWVGFATTLVTDIVSDYISLFVVRSFLRMGRSRPYMSVIIGPLMGVIVVIAVTTVINIIFFFGFFISHLQNSDSTFEILDRSVRASLEWWSDFVLPYPNWRAWLLASLFVHLWLPIFALCVATIRLLNFVRYLVGWTQWFVKGGDHHPFEAIGYVIAAFVFVGTAIIRWILNTAV